MSTFQATLFTIVNCISTKSKINKIQIQMNQLSLEIVGTKVQLQFKLITVVKTTQGVNHRKFF